MKIATQKQIADLESGKINRITLSDFDYLIRVTKDGKHRLAKVSGKVITFIDKEKKL